MFEQVKKSKKLEDINMAKKKELEPLKEAEMGAEEEAKKNAESEEEAEKNAESEMDEKAVDELINKLEGMGYKVDRPKKKEAAEPGSEDWRREEAQEPEHKDVFGGSSPAEGAGSHPGMDPKVPSASQHITFPQAGTYTGYGPGVPQNQPNSPQLKTATLSFEKSPVGLKLKAMGDLFEKRVKELESQVSKIAKIQEDVKKFYDQPFYKAASESAQTEGLVQDKRYRF